MSSSSSSSSQLTRLSLTSKSRISRYHMPLSQQVISTFTNNNFKPPISRLVICLPRRGLTAPCFDYFCSSSSNQYCNYEEKLGSFNSNSHNYRSVLCFSTAKSDSKEPKSQSQSWIDLYLPEIAHLYAKTRTLGQAYWHLVVRLALFLVFLSIALSAPPGKLPDLWMMTLFGSVSLLLRSAACTVNDIVDRDIDAMVGRTKSRPIASGVLTPVQGLCFLGFQLLLGLLIHLQLNNYSRILGAISLLLNLSYPFTKRITYWPQAYLGLTINFGTSIAWAAVNGSLDLPIVLLLYASGVCWTLVYDTIYAHQDKEDDVKVGVKSTALKFGESTKEWLTGFGIASISSLALSGFNANLGWPYYAFLAAATGHLGWQIMTVNLSCPTDCMRKFISNKWFGAIVFSRILFGKIYGNIVT